MHEHGHEHGHEHEHRHEHGMGGDGEPVDPVCGMTVDEETATTAGLTARHEGTTYSFCGPGCKLEFRDDPARYLDPSYQPST